MMNGGEVFKTKYGDVEILRYVNKNNVHVRFIDTGFEKNARYDHILSGSVRDGRKPTVLGVGYTDGEVTRTPEGRPLAYKHWSGMLTRAYSDKYKTMKPSYVNCTTSESFKSYSRFKGWCEQQIGFGNNGWCLDKDILVKGNKVYSENTCCFVPHEVNTLFIMQQRTRGKYPLGVTLNKKMSSFSCSISLQGKLMYLGSYETPEKAFLVYKGAKEDYIKEVANKWKDKIDPRAYEALMNYQVEITD